MVSACACYYMFFWKFLEGLHVGESRKLGELIVHENPC
jgi:hypothetical protein